MRQVRVLLVLHKSSHHSGHSGYHRFLYHLKNTTIISPKFTVPYTLAKKIAKKLGKDLGNYDTFSFYKEIQIVLNLLKNKGSKKIVHYLHGERDVGPLVQSFVKTKNVKFIATFHKPPDIIEGLVKNKKYLNKLDAAIVVGHNQLKHLKCWLGLKKVFYIPHGVDVNFFRPNFVVRPKNQKNILFVGQHLRDFTVFNSTISLLLDENDDYCVDVILRKEFASKVLCHASVTVHSGISDDRLLHCYQKAHLLFIPLKEVTACNSILEGLACGLPIVTTLIGGNKKYLEGTESILLKTNSSFFDYKEAIKTLIQKDKDLSVSKRSRQKSLEYRWEEVADELYKFYSIL